MIGLVPRSELQKTLRQFDPNCLHITLDTETTGLSPYRDSVIFSIILCVKGKAFYFNFKSYEGLEDSYVHNWDEFKAEFAFLSNSKKPMWFMHNAKFDLHFLRKQGIEIKGFIHDTQIVGRLLENNLFHYSLDALGERIGHKKNAEVKNYIKTHKLYSTQVIADKEIKVVHYDKVPLNLMVPYGIQDVIVTEKLGEYQLEECQKIELSTPLAAPSFYDAVLNEENLVKVILDMESVGIKFDRGYCIQSINYEMQIQDEAKEAFKEMTFVDYVDSAKTFQPIFDAYKLPYPVTSKGNASFSKDVLDKLDHPIIKIISTIREAQKRETTYFRNFLMYADYNDVIHASLNQAGTETGRFSSSNPNMQNLGKNADREAKNPVRRAFIPRPDYCFVMIDYDQMEYRLMLDYAGENSLIEKVIGGLDVHQATSDMMSKVRPVNRTSAKTLNFMLLYGGGVAKLCLSLFSPKLAEEDLKKVAGLLLIKNKTPKHISNLLELPLEIVEHDASELKKAYDLKELYYSQLPQVEKFTKKVIKVAETRGYLRTWLGTRLLYSPNFAYKAPNGLIQGGCAQIVKVAMNRLSEHLKGRKSRMILQIHDEILFEVHKDELNIVPELKKIMLEAYPHKMLPMDCSVEHSWKSWADKVKGEPLLETRKH